MTGTALVPRPTEQAALAAACRSGRPLPLLPRLFVGLSTAYALGDRHGVSLFGHAIVRTFGGAR